MRLVILCGGSGTRLWPISRVTTPKQFAKIFDNKSLFELTIERNLEFFDGITVVVNEQQFELCQSQIPKSLRSKTDFIIEPCPRNTAPAVALAAFNSPNEDLFIVPSDHLINNQEIYKDCINKAKELAKQKKLVTFGLKPTHAETGFGYIEANGNEVIAFKEKPDLRTANEYISSGNFLWNSGMFYFNAATFLVELQTHASEIYQHSELAFNSCEKENNTIRINLEMMQNIPATSIDYAIMEKSSNVSVVKAEFYWTDLGSFEALWEVLDKDEFGNTLNEKLLNINSHNNLVLGTKRIIATFDIQDLIIVDTEDALLIGKRGSGQKVKQLLEQVKEVKPELLK